MSTACVTGSHQPVTTDTDPLVTRANNRLYIAIRPCHHCHQPLLVTLDLDQNIISIGDGVGGGDSGDSDLSKESDTGLPSPPVTTVTNPLAPYLAGLIDYVRRIGGFMTPDDQALLRAATLALRDAQSRQGSEP